MKRPAPRVSVRLADRASEGPLLVTVIVYVVWDPASIVGWESVLVTARVALVVIVFVSSAVRGLPFSFSNEAPTTEIYTLSLHDALPILARSLNVLVWLGVSVPRLIELP